MGVTKISDHKYRARYTEKGVRHNVGTFKTKKEAEDEIERHKFRSGMDYEEAPVPVKFKQSHIPKTFKERISNLWQRLKKSLEDRNLI